VSLSFTSNVPGLKQSHGHSLGLPASEVNVGRWYGIDVEINADGTGAMTLTDGGGKLLAKEENFHVGRGPFYVILGQSEGWPHTAGANEGVWSWLKVCRGR